MNIIDLITNVDYWNISERAKSELKSMIFSLEEERATKKDNIQCLIKTHKLHGFIKALWYNNNITQLQYTSIYQYIFGF